MAYILTLANAQVKLVYLAAIDGKNGANGRHSPTNQGLILNMAYRDLMSRAGALGLPHGLTTSSGTLSAALAGEDFISLDIPLTASEVVGVDVRGGIAGAQYQKLDPISWEQRRDVSPALGDRRDFAYGGLVPPHGVGFWAMREAPSVSGATLSPGKLAIWPTRLAGLSYTLSQIRQWVEISSGTDVFMLHEGWETWFINKAVMAVTQRDTNKRGNYDTAFQAFSLADADLEKQAARHNKAGSGEPTSYQGINL